MKCPDCNADLVQKKRDGVEMDVCQSCQGMWLTRQELNELEDEVFDFGDQRKGQPHACFHPLHPHVSSMRKPNEKISVPVLRP